MCVCVFILPVTNHYTSHFYVFNYRTFVIDNQNSKIKLLILRLHQSNKIITIICSAHEND